MPDPRSGQNIQHPLLSLLSIAICGVICGADNWVDVEMYGQSKHEWLASFLELPHGIPSHDTFGRVVRWLNPDVFEARFRDWTPAVCLLTEGQVLAFDGKQLRRSKDGLLGRQALHLVSVWASDNHLVLAQEPVAQGSNEIPTLLKLLGMLDLSGSIVTIDGIGCQTEIGEALVEQPAD